MIIDQEKDEYRKLLKGQLGPIQPLWPIDILLFLIALIGFILNIILLFVTYRQKKSWAVDIILIFIVGLFDILWCATLHFSLISRWILGESVLVEDSKWCIFSAISFNAAFFSATLCTSILALARYLAIVHKFKLNNKLWIGVSVTFIFIIWSVFFQRVFTVLPIILLSGFYCFPQILGLGWTAVFFSYFTQYFLYFSFILIPLCYILITIYYRRQLTLLNHHKDERQSCELNRNIYQLIAILMAYSVTLFPEHIHTLLTINYNLKRTSLSDGIVMGLVFCVSSINAIFALLMHEGIHLEFRTLLGFPARKQYFPYEY